MQGSKYVQSSLGNIFKDVQKKLKNDIFVLFSGTPCQVDALKSYLRKDYPNLLTVDIICHGVPSPKVWRMYLEEMNIIGLLVQIRLILICLLILLR